MSEPLRQGYQPTGSATGMTSPPRGGSGVPAVEPREWRERIETLEAEMRHVGGKLRKLKEIEERMAVLEGGTATGGDRCHALNPSVTWAARCALRKGHDGPHRISQEGLVWDDPEPELLPCPFCGEEPYLHEPDFPGDQYQVGCHCGADEDADEPGAIWRNGKTFEVVAARWNVRVP